MAPVTPRIEEDVKTSRTDDRVKDFLLIFLICWLPVSVFLLLMCSAGKAHGAEGLRFEVGYGHCESQRGGRGSWWNDHYETNLDLNDRCGQMGISATPWQWRGYDLGWRLAYVDFGRISINSVMAARDEDQLSNPDGSACDWGNGGRGCLIRVKGGGHATGISFGGVAERDLGALVLGAEGGLFAYYNHFTVAVTAHPDPSVTPDWWWYRQWDLARGWQLTPYAGASVRYDVFYVAARVYARMVSACREDGCETFNGGSSGVTNGAAWQVTAGMSIPFDL
jgi:hypothetical protein